MHGQEALGEVGQLAFTALRGGGPGPRSLEEEVKQRHVRRREERPAREPRVCARWCRRPGQRVPGGLQGAFPGAQLEPLWVFHVMDEQLFFLPFFLLLPSAGTGGPPPLTPRGPSHDICQPP